MIASTTIECRPATAAEVPACTALVPQATLMPAEWLIARLDGEVAGAAALVWRSWATPGGFPLWVAVAPALRRCGIGRALVRAAIAMAGGETPGLWGLEPIDAGSEASEFAQACGLRAHSQTFLFETPLAFVQANLNAKAALARAAGGAAARAVVVPLDAANAEAVGWLVAGALGNVRGDSLEMAARLASDPTSHSISMVAMVDGAIAGAVLARIYNSADSGESHAAVDAAAVAPAWRGSHLSQIMMEQVVANALAAGVTVGRFQSEDHVVSTFDVGGRVAVGPVPSKVRFYRPLGVAAS
jgi:GNAT superfamily N-acetyltransferase